MKKFYAIGLALMSVFAFGAITASAAFAELEWLANGNAIPAGGLETSSEGLLQLIHLAGGFLNPEAVIHCEGVFDGLVLPGAPGLDTVEALLSGGVGITLTNTLSCVNELNCPTPLVVAEGFPWNTELVLMEVAGKEVWLDLFFKNQTELPGYEILCDGLGVETLCEGETSAVVTNDPNGVLGVFNKAELEAEGLEGTCAATANVALQNGEGLTVLVNGETLSISGT